MHLILTGLKNKLKAHHRSNGVTPEPAKAADVVFAIIRLFAFEANSHTYHAVPCRVLRERPHVVDKIGTANRETPRGSPKKPNLGRSTADVNSHIPCRAPAVLCRGLEK